MRAMLREQPELDPQSLELDDLLRYTLRVEDEPAGRHAEAIRQVLTALRQRGHRVERLKNYWPDGDNYSGINTVLRSADGTPWELQFHTAASLGAAKQTRAWYEELRSADTPLPRKQQLFDMMTEVWDAVPVPAGILQPGALGPHEQILERQRP